MKKACWLWFPGDLEIYHGMQQNLSREERGFSWPAYWKIDDCRKNVNFRRKYQLSKETDFTVHSYSMGYVLVNEEKYPLNQLINCKEGICDIVVHLANPEGLPSIYVTGDEIYSDESWLADDYICKPQPVGFNRYFTEVEQNPMCWQYESKRILPEEVLAVDGGALFKFPQEITATLELKTRQSNLPLRICYGESETEARDVENCYYYQELVSLEEKIPKRAFRYIFIPEIEVEEVTIVANHHYVDIPVKAAFNSNDELLNNIWKVSLHTFQLCSGIFFIDGVKRDKWIWSGDAYQALFVNQYLMADEDINRRTLIALRGNDPMVSHINTIVDYSLLWIISIYQHYLAYVDEKFVRWIYPKMESLMEFCATQLDKNGFLIGREKDWIFIDWGTLDKEGALGAEQFLYSYSLFVMEELGHLCGLNTKKYQEQKVELDKNIKEYFWDNEKGAFIDSFTSASRYISRQTNIFAILFGALTDNEKELIYKNVLSNPQIPPITTPYFKFYETEALCQLGYIDDVHKEVLSYWGGMLNYDTTTFWEEYNPEAKDHYSMYGDPYGKSMCHAWAASPIYTLGRHFVGLRPLKPGYEKFEIAPKLEYFSQFNVTLPVNNGKVSLLYKDGILKIITDKEGGTLIIGDRIISLQRNEEVEIAIGVTN